MTEKTQITFQDFQKLDLRVGKIEDAQKVENSEKLVRLSVDIGGEKRRILAGISQYYNPADLIGKKIVVVVNLKPKKMIGEESVGMLLAADVDGRPVLITPDSDVPEGSTVR